MRALVLLFFIFFFIGGCTTERPCRSGTLLVRVSLDGAAANATQLLVTVSIDGSARVNPPLPHTVGAAGGNLEVDFPAGYPRGSQAVVEVVALDGSLELGRGSTPPVELTSGCTNTSLTVVGTTADLSVPFVVFDLAMEMDLLGEIDLLEPPDLSGLDLTRVFDLAGIDFFNCMTATEDCFNNMDDDCDGLVDCDDGDCVGGASPKARCVPDPGSFTAGILATGSCPTAWPTSTAVYQGLTSSCSTNGCGGCTTIGSSFGGPDDCFVLVEANSDSNCGSGTGAQTRASGTPVCRYISPLPAGGYHSANEFYYDGFGNNPTGTSSKNTPQWNSSNLFCRNGAVGGGCIAGNLCVPAAANHCVMKTGPANPCPSGYNPQAAWYTGYDDSARTCQCSCINTTQGACSGTPVVTLYTDLNCTTGAQTMNSACSNAENYSAYTYAKATGMTVSQHATSAPSAYMSGTTMPTGQQTICCTP